MNLIMAISAAFLLFNTPSDAPDSQAKPDPAKLLEQGMLDIKNGQVKEGARTLGRILNDFPGTPTAEQARNELDKLAEIIRKSAEVRLEALEKRLEELKSEKPADVSKIMDPWEQAIAAMDNARKLHTGALGAEAERRATRAHQKWLEAEKLLLLAQNNLNALLKTTKDTKMIDSCKEKIKESRTWRIKIYISLAQSNLIFYSNRNEALRWVNKAMQIDPFDATATQLKQDLAGQSMK